MKLRITLRRGAVFVLPCDPSKVTLHEVAEWAADPLVLSVEII